MRSADNRECWTDLLQRSHVHEAQLPAPHRSLTALLANMYTTWTCQIRPETIMSDTMQATQIHFKPAQKKALRARARANKTNVAEEVRRAVDAYLTGVTSDELALLDQATRQAETMLAQMSQTLKDTNTHLREVFAERDRLKARR
jgi:hypothetical protein